MKKQNNVNGKLFLVGMVEQKVCSFSGKDKNQKHFDNTNGIFFSLHPSIFTPNETFFFLCA